MKEKGEGEFLFWESKQGKHKKKREKNVREKSSKRVRQIERENTNEQIKCIKKTESA